jgi:hypothetical protein
LPGPSNLASKVFEQAGQCVQQKGPRQFPMAAYRALCDPACCGDLDETEAGKKMPLDDLSQFRIGRLQLTQGRIDLDQFIQRARPGRA